MSLDEHGHFQPVKQFRDLGGVVASGQRHGPTSSASRMLLKIFASPLPLPG